MLWILGDEMIFSFVVQLFPSQCPFERDFILFGRMLVPLFSTDVQNPSLVRAACGAAVSLHRPSLFR